MLTLATWNKGGEGGEGFLIASQGYSDVSQDASDAVVVVVVVVVTEIVCVIVAVCKMNDGFEFVV